jgi:hypothetical protein
MLAASAAALRAFTAASEEHMTCSRKRRVVTDPCPSVTTTEPALPLARVALVSRSETV